MRPAITTTSRHFGNDGRQIGVESADRLTISFYEKSLFDEAAKCNGTPPELFERAENR